MKILQGGVLIIVGLFLTSFSIASDSTEKSTIARATTSAVADKADVSAIALAKADSLFHLKQYTQSFDLYNSLFQNNLYSPAMLLKMAYIQEGLGHLGQSMFFLNLYYLATSDPQALTKIEDVAAKNKLEGYQPSSSEWIWTTLQKHREKILPALASLCLLSLAGMFFQKIKRHQRPVASAITMLVFLALLGLINFAGNRGQGIVASPSTYLMSGPSSGSSVISIVGEGHRLQILGRSDVWVKVNWLNDEAYVKESDLLRVSL